MKMTVERCREPRQLYTSIYIGEACGHVAPRAATYDYIVLVGSEYDAAHRASLYNQLGIDVIVYPLEPGKAPTLVSLLRLLSGIAERIPYEKILIEGFGSEGIVAAALLVLEAGLDARTAAQRVLSLGHGLLSPLEARQLKLIEQILVDAGSPHRLYRLIEDAYSRGFLHGDAHASSVAELAVEINSGLERIGAPKRMDNYTLFRDALLAPDEPRNIVHAVASALDSTLVGAVRVIGLERRGNIIDVLVGCETLMHREQCWPEVEASRGAFTTLAQTLGASRVTYLMMEPEEVACIYYASIDRGLCEDQT